MSIPTLDLTLSSLESARFGLRIYRAVVDGIDADALIAALDRQQVDVAILRVPAWTLPSIQELRRHGLDPIVADTIVHYEADLQTLPAHTREHDPVVLRRATEKDANLLESLAREVFAGYVTHYHANPLLPAAKILDGYAEWASDPVRTKGTHGGAWLVEAAGELAGFSCYAMDRETSRATGVLNGILPAQRGRGIYRRMLQQMLRVFHSSGITHFATATQVQNVTVQRIWVSEGLTLCRAENTVHINALRGGTRAAAGMQDDAADSRDLRALIRRQAARFVPK